MCAKLQGAMPSARALPRQMRQCSPVAQRLTVFGEAMRVSHTSMMDTKQSAALKDWAREIRSKGHLRVCVGFQSALLHNLSVVCSTPYPCLTRPTTPLAFPPTLVPTPPLHTLHHPFSLFPTLSTCAWLALMPQSPACSARCICSLMCSSL